MFKALAKLFTHFFMIVTYDSSVKWMLPFIAQPSFIFQIHMKSFLIKNVFYFLSNLFLFFIVKFLLECSWFIMLC